MTLKNRHKKNFSTDEDRSKQLENLLFPELFHLLRQITDKICVNWSNNFLLISTVVLFTLYQPEFHPVNGD